MAVTKKKRGDSAVKSRSESPGGVTAKSPVESPGGVTAKSPAESPGGVTAKSPDEATRGVIVAFGGQKGGSGKTTTTVALAVEFQRLGWSVALVDADPQGSAWTWSDVAREGGSPTPEMVRMTAGFLAVLPLLAAKHDVVLVDCPAHLDAIQGELMLVVDTMVIVGGSSPIEFWSLTATLRVLGQARALRPELDVVALLTRQRKGEVLSRQARNALEKGNLAVLDAELGDRATYRHAIGVGLGPSTFAPASEAAREVRCLAAELERRWSQ